MPDFISELTIFAPIENWKGCGFEIVNGELNLSNAKLVFKNSKLEDSRVSSSRVVVRDIEPANSPKIHLDHLMVHVPTDRILSGEILEVGSDVRLDVSKSDVEDVAIWGIAFRVDDISVFTKILDESKLGLAKQAEQENQMVSTFRSAAQLGIPCALMSISGA